MQPWAVRWIWLMAGGRRRPRDPIGRGGTPRNAPQLRPVLPFEPPAAPKGRALSKDGSRSEGRALEASSAIETPAVAQASRFQDEVYATAVAAIARHPADFAAAMRECLERRPTSPTEQEPVLVNLATGAALPIRPGFQFARELRAAAGSSSERPPPTNAMSLSAAVPLLRPRWWAPVFGAALALTTACTTEAREDPLPRSLRRRVERLERAARAEPTDASNYLDRVSTLWDWGNALALAGEKLPVNWPRDVANARTADATGKAPDDALLRTIDQRIRELERTEREPDALGELRFASSEPLESGSWVTLEQVWTVGSRPLQPGGKIVIAKQLATDQGRFQHEDPKAEHYVSIRSSDPGARFEPTKVVLLGMHGAFRGNAPTIAFELQGTALDAGDTVTVTYGDRSQGSRGWRTTSFTDRRVPAADLPRPRRQGRSAEPAMAVVAGGRGGEDGESRRVRAGGGRGRRDLRPARARRGPFLEPHLGAGAGLGDPRRRSHAGARRGGRTGGDARRGSAPRAARHLPARGGLRRRRALDRARTRSGWKSAPRRRILWGETHVHAGLSEGQGTPEGLFRYAVEDSRLDFVGYSEHDVWLDDAEWKKLQDLARRYTESGDLIAFLGYEWTASTAERRPSQRLLPQPPIASACRRRKRPSFPISIAGSPPPTGPTTCWSSRTRTKPATGREAIPTSSAWSRSTPCTAASSSSATSTSSAVGASASSPPPTSIERSRATRRRSPRSVLCCRSAGSPA